MLHLPGQFYNCQSERRQWLWMFLELLRELGSFHPIKIPLVTFFYWNWKVLLKEFLIICSQLQVWVQDQSQDRICYILHFSVNKIDTASFPIVETAGIWGDFTVWFKTENGMIWVIWVVLIIISILGLYWHTKGHSLGLQLK